MYNFGLSGDQQALKDALRRFCDTECSSERVRGVIAQSGFASDQWRGLAELGVLGLGIGEAYGGSGLGTFDLAVVIEELGRTVLPAPVLETLVAARLIERLGSADQKQALLPAIAAGDSMVSLAIDDADSYWQPEATTATASPVGGTRYRLSGTKPFAAYGDTADVVLVTVAVESRGTAIAVLGRDHLQGRVTVQDGIDDSYRIAEIVLDGIEIGEGDFLGSPDPDGATLREAWNLAAVLAGAELLGCLERSLELIVDYSKVRVQFGKPIGSYQAMKHRCADLLVDLEAARGAVYYAAQAIQTGADDLPVAVSSAKAFASDAAVRGAEHALQSFGAIGFTWEFDIHFYLKRARRLDKTFGDASHHRELIARQL